MTATDRAYEFTKGRVLDSTYAGGEPQIRDGELEDVRWFSRAELADALAERGALRLPPPEAIAHRLIRDWLEETTG